MAALGDGGWHTAVDLMRSHGLNDRVLRMVAEASEGHIISGQQGYKLTVFATLDEVAHAENWLKAQAQKMGNYILDSLD